MQLLPLRAAALALLLYAGGGAANAAAGADLLLAYDVRYSGVTIMKLEARIDLAEEGPDGGYSVELEGRTVGLLDRLKPIAFTAKSAGVSSGDALEPALYSTTTVKRQKRKGLTITFPPDETPVTRFSPPDDAEELPPPELLEGSLDPASAFLTLLRSVYDGASCSGSVEVFDGKRLYELTFEALPRQMLQKAGQSAYGGEAKRCRLAMRPIHGFKPGKHRPLDGTVIWFGEVLKDAPPLPVRIDAEISLGPVVLHLDSAKRVEQQARR